MLFRSLFNLNAENSRRRLTETCTGGTEGLKSTCTHNNEDILILMNDITIETNILITGIKIIHPSFDDKSSNMISITTYSDTNMVTTRDYATNVIGSNVECNFPCESCSDFMSSCDSCLMNNLHQYYLLEGEKKCADISKGSCPNSYLKDDEDALCLKCDPNCYICADTIDNCLSCPNSKYLLDNECIDSCPIGMSPNIYNSCLNCSANCNSCLWQDSDSSLEICNECSSGYVLNEYTTAEGVRNVTCIIAENTSENFGWFLHLIIAGVIIGFALIFLYKSTKGQIIPSIGIIVDLATIACLITQIILAKSNDENQIFYATLLVLSIHIVLNIIYSIFSCFRLNDKDEPLENLKYDRIIILALSSTITFQFARLFYCRFLFFEIPLCSAFKKYEKLLKDLNIFSYIQIVVFNLMIIAYNIYRFINNLWGTTLYTTMMESLILF